MTLEEALGGIRKAVLAERSKRTYLSAARYLWRFGDDPAEALLLAHASGASPSLVKQMVAVAKLLGCQVERPKLKASHPLRDVPDVEQMRLLVNAVAEPYRIVFEIQWATGMRVGEVLALRRQDVDTFKRCIYVRGTREVDGTRKDTTKTSRDRTLPVVNGLLPLLTAHLDIVKGEDLFPWDYSTCRPRGGRRLRPRGPDARPRSRLRRGPRGGRIGPSDGTERPGMGCYVYSRTTTSTWRVACASYGLITCQRDSAMPTCDRGGEMLCDDIMAHLGGFCRGG